MVEHQLAPPTTLAQKATERSVIARLGRQEGDGVTQDCSSMAWNFMKQKDAPPKLPVEPAKGKTPSAAQDKAASPSPPVSPAIKATGGAIDDSNMYNCSQMAWGFIKHQTSLPASPPTSPPLAAASAKQAPPIQGLDDSNVYNCSQMAWGFVKNKSPIIDPAKPSIEQVKQLSLS